MKAFRFACRVGTVAYYLPPPRRDLQQRFPPHAFCNTSASSSRGGVPRVAEPLLSEEARAGGRSRFSRRDHASGYRAQFDSFANGSGGYQASSLWRTKSQGPSSTRLHSYRRAKQALSRVGKPAPLTKLFREAVLYRCAYRYPGTVYHMLCVIESALRKLSSFGLVLPSPASKRRHLLPAISEIDESKRA